MITPIFIPRMGVNIDEVVIGRVFVKVGETVRKGQVLFEIITTKANFDVEADSEGKIVSLSLCEGETIEVCKEVGSIEKN